jgi:SAM-dependent methyltransferase/glycosyltransferase involved in cell wall biosynthesis
VRFILLQNGLKDRHTHFFAETMGWLEACRKSEHRVVVYAHTSADPVVLMETNGISVFPLSPGQRLPDAEHLSDKMTLVRASDIYADVLSKLPIPIQPDDVVVVPYSTEHEILGMAKWLRSVNPVDRPRLVFIFHHPNLNWKIDTKIGMLESNFSVFRLVFKELLAFTQPDRVRLMATNRALSQVLGQILKLPVSVCPVPIDYFEDEVFDGYVNNNCIPAHIGVLGEFRPEKGALLIAPVVAAFNRVRPGRKIFIQTHFSGTISAPGLDDLHQIANDDMTLFDRELTQTGYANQLKNTDILLLPYQSQRYALRISAVFAEAVAYGVVTVVPADTWMSNQLLLGHGAGVAFENRTVNGICDALISASDSFDELKKSALLSAPSWREHQCTGALVAHIISLFSDHQARETPKKPLAPWHNAVLQTHRDVQTAVDQVEALNLPLAGHPAKNWDALGALDLILRVANPSSHILDAGAEKYSVILPWLSRYGFKNLLGINLVFPETQRTGNILYEKGDITHTKYDTSTFDVVTCLSVIEHGVDLEKFFREMFRVIKENGYLIVSTDYWETPINTEGQHAYGVPIKVFCASEIEQLINIARKFNFELTANLNLGCNQKAVNWMPYDLNYTFIMLSFRKISG